MEGLEQELLVALVKKVDDVAASVNHLDGWAGSTDARLSKLNGSVAKREARLGTLETKATVQREQLLAFRTADAAAELAARQEDAAIKLATEKEDAKYQRFVDLAVKSLAVGALILTLDHGPQLIRCKPAKNEITILPLVERSISEPLNERDPQLRRLGRWLDRSRNRCFKRRVSEAPLHCRKRCAVPVAGSGAWGEPRRSAGGE